MQPHIFLGIHSKLELKANKDKATGIDLYNTFIKIAIKDKSVEYLDSEIHLPELICAELRRSSADFHTFISNSDLLPGFVVLSPAFLVFGVVCCDVQVAHAC